MMIVSIRSGLEGCQVGLLRVEKVFLMAWYWRRVRTPKKAEREGEGEGEEKIEKKEKEKEKEKGPERPTSWRHVVFRFLFSVPPSPHVKFFSPSVSSSS